VKQTGLAREQDSLSEDHLQFNAQVLVDLELQEQQMNDKLKEQYDELSSMKDQQQPAGSLTSRRSSLNQS